MMPGIRSDQSIPLIDDYKHDILANYSGSDRKDGVVSPDGKRYLIKYAERHQSINDLDTSYVNNVVCEDLSSHILHICGYDTHFTFLATRQGELVVACENFLKPGEHLIEFGRYMRKHYDSKDIDRTPSLNQIDYIFSNDIDLKEHAKEFKRVYAERLIGDALVGNFDRHMGNFGYIVSENGTIKPSPIYDNASTLFPNLSEHGMKDVMSSEKEIFKRTLLFPKAALSINGNKVGYLDIMDSNYDPVFSTAVENKVPEIIDKLPAVYEYIESQKYLSDVRKKFYKTIIEFRANYILVSALKRIQNHNYDMTAYNRLKNGQSYTEKMFESDFLKFEKTDIKSEEKSKRMQIRETCIKNEDMEI